MVSRRTLNRNGVQRLCHEHGNLYTINKASERLRRFTPYLRHNDTVSWEDFCGSYSSSILSANF